MVDRYWRQIEDVENDIKNAMQISGILLKLKGYDNELSKISNNENDISSNLGKINNNSSTISTNFKQITGNISSNLGKIHLTFHLIKIQIQNLFKINKFRKNR